jgi:hypothetical protein
VAPLVFVCSWLIAVSSVAAVAGAQMPERSVSSTRQFVVYGTDVTARGAICDFAEQTKRELLALLGLRDEWSAAIIINAQYSRANLPEMPRLTLDLAQTGFGLKLQLNLVIDSGVGHPEIRRELLRALLLEMIYRSQPNLPAGAAYASPPDWFLEGVPAQSADLAHDRVRAILAVPVAAGSVLPLERFLEQRPELLDGPGRNLYRGYAFALVDLLSRSPNGPRHLAAFLFDLPAASNDHLAELKKHFPGLLDSERAEAAWQEQIARISAGQPYQLLGSAETERRLSEMLRLRVVEHDSKKSYELAQFQIFLKNKSANEALRHLGRDLSVLATRGHPVYARVIADYAEVATLLLRRKTLDVPRRLARLEKMRKAIVTQMREIDDYLNWFEATSLAGPSGEFADYLKAAERAARPEHTKRDPISVYLNALETEFDR